MEQIEEREKISFLAVFEKVMGGLAVEGAAMTEGEGGVCERFWKDSLEWIDWESTGPLSLMLAEEALMLRVLAYRLLMRVQSGDLMVEREKGPAVLNPVVEAWAKTQERLRKVMKELLEQCKQRDGGDLVTLASMMGPIVEQGEGVLDDALEFEARKKSVEKAGDGEIGD